MSDPFHTTRRVEFADTDMAGIIHFTSFFRYMEEVEHAFLRSLGLSVVMHGAGESLGWPRVSASCTFSRPVRFEDVVDVHLRVARLGNTSITYEFLFLKDGHDVARGTVTTVCCRMREEGLPEAVPIPALFAEKIQPLCSASDPATGTQTGGRPRDGRSTSA